jgi:hypothetical protein
MKCNVILQADSYAGFSFPDMRKLKTWGLILCISIFHDGVVSLLPTRKTRRQCSHRRAPAVPAYYWDPLLSSNEIRVNGQLFLSRARDSSASVSDPKGDKAWESENEDEQIDGFDHRKINNGNTNRIEAVENKTVSTIIRGDIDRSTPRENNLVRNERWLEDATDKLLDLSTLPLGSLTENDVLSITGLMVRWSRRKSIEGAIAVERLLKRVVDDMRAGNQDVHVSTRMYTIAIKAWGKSDEVAGAERAQNIHDAMIQTYERTKNSSIKPTTKSYNTLILAWAKSENPSAMHAAEKTLRDMLTKSDQRSVRPDSVTYGTMLDLYSRKSEGESVTKAETLFRSMNAFKVKKTSYVYSALQDVYLRSGTKYAPKQTMAVLKKMLDDYSMGNIGARPTVTNFNNVLCAYSRTFSKKTALQAVEMLNQIETPKEEGGYDVDPDRLSYFHTILACSRCPNHTLGSNLAEPLLERMEERSKAEAKRREELSITAPPLISLDIECFNVVLTALSKSRDSDAVDRLFGIISRMEEYADKGEEHLRPSTRSLNSALNALSRVKDNNSVRRAELTLDRMLQLHANGVSNIKPDPFSFTAILRCYQGLGTPEAAQRGNDILCWMEELYEKKVLDEPPDTFHYTIVCSTWALSKSKIAPQKCIEILSRMKEKDKEGWPKVTPNIRTYNAVLGECGE